RRASSSRARRYRVDARVREPHEVAWSELELQSAPAAVDEDRLVFERRAVEVGRQLLPLAEWARPTRDVAGRSPRTLLVRELRTLAERLQVELGGDRDAGDVQFAVD